MSAKHTPGPWEAIAVSTCSGAWFSIQPEGRPEDELAETETFATNKTRRAVTFEEAPEAFTDNPNAEEVRANANLIASAP